jgi:two-component system chemotaxis response regulator CheB
MADMSQSTAGMGRCVVIGGSAGATKVLLSIAARLPAPLNAAVFVALHRSAHAPNILAQLLNQAGPLPAAEAIDGDVPQRSRIYVAPADRHLLVHPQRLALVHGPRENRSRPAIDPLFRTAARVHGVNVIAVLLSGTLDDGTFGMLAVKQCGGIAIVQDPADAEYPEMPQNALRYVPVDAKAPASELAGLIASHVQRPPPAAPSSTEAASAGALEELPDPVEPVIETRPNHPGGSLTSLICPDCGGPLWERQQQGLLHFRCFEGHGFSAETLLDAQSDEIEAALWTALRSLHETASLARRMSRRAQQRGQEELVRRYEENATAAERHAATLQRMLFRS